jgi:hypothetical protein
MTGWAEKPIEMYSVKTITNKIE